MRQPSPRWQSWRITLIGGELRSTSLTSPLAQRMASIPPTDPLAALKREPAQNGVRTALVAHVQQLIAAGEYDTPERWEAAEEALFGRILGED